MKVKDLIARLQEFDPELPVAVADWQEGYRGASESAAEEVGLGKAEDWEDGEGGGWRYKDAVVIGG